MGEDAEGTLPVVKRELDSGEQSVKLELDATHVPNPYAIALAWVAECHDGMYYCTGYRLSNMRRVVVSINCGTMGLAIRTAKALNDLRDE